MTECVNRDRSLDGLTAAEVLEIADTCWRCRRGCATGKQACSFVLLVARARAREILAAVALTVAAVRARG